VLARAKQAAVRAVARHPLYRVMPPGAARTYAALKYHAEHSGQEEIVRYIRSIGGVPIRRLSAALMAAKALFRAGQDDLLEETLTGLERRYPEAPAVHVLRADLFTFHGRYEEALRSAELGDRPGTSAAAAARVVKLSYRTAPKQVAQQRAVDVVRRFPRSIEALWPVAMHCDNAEHYARVEQTWRERSDAAPVDLLRVVRQLAVAAARAGQIDSAIGWYRAGIELLLEGHSTPPPATTTLAGLGARNAIGDLCEVLDRAGVPFFFAAGTALGLIREGRPLGADGDIDIGVFEQDWDRTALIKVFTDDPRFDLDLHPQTQKVGLRHRGGSPVDIFRFYEEDGRVWHDGVFVRWHNSPFQVVRRDIGGRSLPLPAEPERYLEENYGPEWRVPHPGFDAFTDDAPNLEVTWPEYQRMHFARRAYQFLVSGKRAEAAQELERAGEATLASRLTT
jgi:hypothetical protein